NEEFEMIVISTREYFELSYSNDQKQIAVDSLRYAFSNYGFTSLLTISKFSD
ncbi:hypothetical protein MKW98_027513, partial [Papaver atlanticum]